MLVEEVLIDLGERAVGGVIQAIKIYVHIACRICGLISKPVERRIEVLLHPLPLPLSFVVLEIVGIAFVVV